MPLNVSSMIDQLEKIRDEKDLSKEDFASREMEVSVASYKRWTLGKAQPNTDSIKKIIEYLEKHEN